MALLRRAVDAAWAKCRKARSLRELAACVDAQPSPVNEIMRAQVLSELAQMGVSATWRDVREGRVAFEAAIAGLSAARPNRPSRIP
jgi:predicted transcriptional regulator